MPLDARLAQTTLENLLRDTILYGLGARLQATTIAALRAIPTVGASGLTQRNDDELVCIPGLPVLAFRWSQTATAADNGTTVIKPNDVTGNGRWLSWTSPLRFSQIVGGDATTLDQLTSGPLAKVIGLDKNLSVDEIVELLGGQVPAVVIQSDVDQPEDATLNVGHRYNTNYEFTVHVIVDNLRDRRQAAQGSDVASDAVVDANLGANGLDGLIQALIVGTQLYGAIAGVTDAIRNVRKGRGYNWVSDFAERRIIRSRAYSVMVTEEIPAYASDTVEPTDVFVQAELVDLHQQPSYDANNYLVSGCAPTVGSPLTQSLSAGTAVIAGATVSYAGGAVTFAAYSDTYRDLAANGTMTLTAVTAGGAPPAQAAGTLRIGVSTTNGSIVLSDVPLCQTQANFGPDFDIPI